MPEVKVEQFSPTGSSIMPSQSIAKSNQGSVLKLSSSFISKKKKNNEFKMPSVQLDYIIHYENTVIEKMRTILENNLKQSVGTGLNKSLISLLTMSQEAETFDKNHIPGLMNIQYKKELKNLKKNADELDDLFLSKHGVKVKPERKPKKNNFQEKVE